MENQDLNNQDYSSSEKQKMFAHPFSFKGRIRRKELVLSYIIYLIWVGSLHFMADIVDDMIESIYYMITFIIYYMITFIPMVWFLCAQRAKRCHDIGDSGWYQFIPFFDLWLLFSDGDELENDYGVDPKGRSAFYD